MSILLHKIVLSQISVALNGSVRDSRLCPCRTSTARRGVITSSASTMRMSFQRGTNLKLVQNPAFLDSRPNFGWSVRSRLYRRRFDKRLFPLIFDVKSHLKALADICKIHKIFSISGQILNHSSSLPFPSSFLDEDSSSVIKRGNHEKNTEAEGQKTAGNSNKQRDLVRYFAAIFFFYLDRIPYLQPSPSRIKAHAAMV